MSEYCKRCLQIEKDIREIFAKRFPNMKYVDTFTALAMLGQDPPQEVPPVIVDIGRKPYELSVGEQGFIKLKPTKRVAAPDGE